MSSRVCDRPAGQAGLAEIRAYAELNDFLPADWRFRSFTVPLEEGTAISSLLTGVGIPPQKVDLVLKNGEPAGFEEEISSGDRLSVYPVFETFDIASVQRLRPKPLRTPAFVLDAHLGKLASYLRLLGFDALYSPAYDDEQLVSIAAADRRTLLSKDRALLHDPRLERASRVESIEPRGQLREIVDRFSLEGLVRPFTRCLACNALLTSVPKEDVLDRIPPHVRETRDRFTTCPACRRVFWEGTHYERMTAFISSLIDRSANPPAQRGESSTSDR